MLESDTLGLSFTGCLVPITSWNPPCLIHGGNFNACTVVLRRVDRILLGGLAKAGL